MNKIAYPARLASLVYTEYTVFGYPHRLNDVLPSLDFAPLVQKGMVIKMVKKLITAVLTCGALALTAATVSAVYDPDVIPIEEEVLVLQGSTESLEQTVSESTENGAVPSGGGGVSSGGSTAAEPPQTSYFTYKTNGDMLTVSVNGRAIRNTVDSDIDVIVAVYDGDVLAKTKLYKISGDYSLVTLKDWITDVPEDTDNIRVKAFMWTSDGMCTPLEKDSEITDIPGTAYTVYGRVMATSRDGGLDKDEVMFNVEASNNFDGVPYSATGAAGANAPAQYIFKTGDTNAGEMQFIYSEAIVVHDEKTDEYTILSITPRGTPKTVTFPASAVADDDPVIGKDYIGCAKLPVYRDKTKTSTLKYKIAGYYDTVLYVNGVKIGTATNADIEEYILKNPMGIVTLIDETMLGSTASDGKYDYIMVTYYGDAVVDYTNATSTLNRVYFKANQYSISSKLEWYPEDDIEVRFIKDGKEIDFTELNENDVLSVQYDVTGSFRDSPFYVVYVSSNTIKGKVTSRDTEWETISIGGNDYEINSSMVSVYDFELSAAYKIYLDVFGYIAYFDEGYADKNYGVIVSMYQGNGDDYPTVQLVTSDGEIVSYECKDSTEADVFYNYATGTSMGYISEGFTKTDISSRITTGKTVCTYKIVGGKIRFDKEYPGIGENGLEYRLTTSKFGPYAVNDFTKIIDMGSYMNSSYSVETVRTIELSQLSDNAEYNVCVFDKDNYNTYKFAIIFSMIEHDTEELFDIYGYVRYAAEISESYSENEIGFEVAEECDLPVGTYIFGDGGTNAVDMVGAYCVATVLLKNDEYILLEISAIPENDDADYGVIVAMYKEAVNDYPTVKLITTDGEIVSYECMNEYEANRFYNYAKTGDENGTESFAEFTKSTAPFDVNIISGDTVCSYKIVGDSIKFEKAFAGAGGWYKYDVSRMRIGPYAIYSDTKIIDVHDYVLRYNKLITVPVSLLEDSAEYHAYFFDKNSNGFYNSVLVFSGYAIRPETQLAVVQKVYGQSQVNSTYVDTYLVYRGGNESEELYVESGSTCLKEGDVAAYVVNPEGYVESPDLYVLCSPLTSGTAYENLLVNILSKTDFNTAYTKYLESDGKQNNAIAYQAGKASSKGVYAYVGIVYMKQGNILELFTSQSGGVSNVNGIKDFDLANANVYTFDYAQRAGKGARLSAGNSGNQSASIYNPAYQNDKNEVNWSYVQSEDITPQIAFIKEVDGDVTDAVFYVAP